MGKKLHSVSGKSRDRQGYYPSVSRTCFERFVGETKVGKEMDEGTVGREAESSCSRLSKEGAGGAPSLAVEGSCK